MVDDRRRVAAARASWRRIQLAFVLSGACALAYEVLWGRWLASVLGSSATAAAVVLASYMGGQAGGAALFGRWSSRLRRPLVAYCVVEVAIGATALLFPLLSDRALGLPGPARVALAVAILALPTLLLGGTVPLALRWTEQAELPAGAALGRLYGLNTLGAAVGTLLTGFFLIPELGLRTTNLLAAAGNVSIALAIAPLALRSGRAAPMGAPPPAVRPSRGSATAAPALGLLCALAFASGCVSLGVEVVFIRLLRITLASTTYVFTLVIATFVLGIGLGGLLAARRREDADVVADLALGQALLVVLLLVDWLLAPVTQSLASAFRGGFEATLWQSAATCALLLLPVTVVMGFLFPLLGRLFMQRGGRGAEVGLLYSWNTLGAVAGALGVTLVAIPVLGSSRAYLLLTAIALLAFGAYVHLGRERIDRRVRALGMSAAVVLVGAVSLLPGWSPIYLGISGGYLRGDVRELEPNVSFFAEGRSSNVLVYRADYGASMQVDGKPVASTARADRANQLLLGHLPALLTEGPRRGLVVGMGTAMTLGALAEHDLEQLDIVELEPRVPEAARLFAADNGSVLDRPELRIVFDDGYNFLHATDERYDVITSDPIHPFVRGGSTLYSADYFGRAADRLAPAGVFAHWLPLANMGRGDFEMIVRSFTDVFPFARLYWNGAEGAVLVGRRFAWNDPAIDAGAFARVAGSLATTQIDSAEELESLAFADRSTLVAWAGEGPRSTLDRPLLEFSAPRAMHEWTLDENLRTLRGWRAEWTPAVPRAFERETAAALVVVADLAAEADARRVLAELERHLACGKRQACRPELATGTLRSVLFDEASGRGERMVEAFAASPEAATPELRALARDLLSYARLLSPPGRDLEAREVERALRQLTGAGRG